MWTVILEQPVARSSHLHTHCRQVVTISAICFHANQRRLSLSLAIVQASSEAEEQHQEASEKQQELGRLTGERQVSRLARTATEWGFF